MARTETRTEPKEPLAGYGSDDYSFGVGVLDGGDEEDDEDEKNDIDEDRDQDRDQDRNTVSNVARLPSRLTNSIDSDNNNHNHNNHNNNDDQKAISEPQSWNDTYQEFVSHLKKHRQWPNENTNKRLTVWLLQQQVYMMGKDKRLTTRRIAKLDRLGFAWKPGVPDVHEFPIKTEMQFMASWMTQYATLRMYLEKHERWPSKESNDDLCEWVRKQQESLLIANDDLDDTERVQKEELDKVGIDWKNDMADQLFSPTDAYKALGGV